jgi:hypothetical protein
LGAVTWPFVLVAVVAAIVLFFAWANRTTAKNHARFTRNDVEAALAEFVSPDSMYCVEWDLFLGWPIDDPYLESIRQECLRIRRESQSEFSAETFAKVSALLANLRNGS